MSSLIIMSRIWGNFPLIPLQLNWRIFKLYFLVVEAGEGGGGGGVLREEGLVEGAALAID